MEGIIRTVKEKYFFILIPGDRQIFCHTESGWLDDGDPVVGDCVSFDLIPSDKPQFKEKATRVRRIVATGGANVLAGAKDTDTEVR